jgi:hypothetical protein
MHTQLLLLLQQAAHHTASLTRLPFTVRYLTRKSTPAAARRGSARRSTPKGLQQQQQQQQLQQQLLLLVVVHPLPGRLAAPAHSWSVCSTLLGAQLQVDPLAGRNS